MATAILTLPDPIVREIGRIDLSINSQLVAGLTRHGGTVRYAFRMPTPPFGVNQVSARVFAKATDAYGEVRRLCAAMRSVKVMAVDLYLDDKVPRGHEIHALAFVEGGKPPYRFEWSPPGRTSDGDGNSYHYLTFKTSGRKQVTVVVTDSLGRTVTRDQSTLVVGGVCAVVITGSTKLKIGEAGNWTATFAGNFRPFSFRFAYGDSVWTLNETDENVQHFSAKAQSDSRVLVVIANDRYDCGSKTTFPVELVSVPSQPSDGGGSTPVQRTQTGGCQDPNGCACPGGGRTWQIGQTCCGNVICQPGTRCLSAGNCR